MKLAHSVRLAAALTLAAGSVGAQEAPADLPETKNTRLFAKIERAVIAVHSIFGAPLHPVIGTVAPGGGWGAGLGYTAPLRGPWHFGAKGIWTLNTYKLAEAVAGYRDRRAEFEGFGRWRDMTSLDFFGPGTGSNLFDRTNFRLKDPVVGAHGKFRVASWLALGGRVEQLWPEATAGKHPSIPTISDRFTPVEAPGLFVETPRFGRYQAAVEMQLPAGVGDAFYQGTKSRVTYALYDDQEAELFNFRRLDVEAQQVVAGIGAHHRLTFSGWASTTMTDAGQQVPFYLQQTLGGKSAIRSVHEDRLGSDGTDATLRGYRDLRFRDRNLLLLQAEYRVPLWGPIDATLFADAGKVTSTRDELDLNDLRRDFGFSLSVMKGWATPARVDVGFGSGEGTRVWLSLGELTP
ncbi:MAG: BamA/TamA family outer membrane protein [Gemmatimonadaceae bacterium]